MLEGIDMKEKTETNMLIDYPDVLNFNQLCEILHIGRQSAYRLLQTNKIKHVRVGKKYIVPKLSVIEFLRDSK